MNNSFMKEKKNIVVFGATGGVGVYTSLHLAEMGYNVIAVGKRKNDNGFFKENNIDYYPVDITRYETFSILPTEEIYAIVHLAGYLPARMDGYNPQVYIDVNITGTLNILQYAIAVKVDRFIYSQSMSDVDYLFGSSTPIKEDSISRFPLNNDHSVYSITKTAASNLIKHYSVKYDFKYFALRLPNIYLYHPNPKYFVDGIERWQGARMIMKQAINGEDIEVWGDPNRLRDMIYVKDCTQIIEKVLSSNSNGGIFNVGTGIGISREEQVQGIIDVFSPPSKRSKKIYRSDMPDSPQYIFDVSRTISELGYVPRYDYISYLKDFKEEMKKNRFEKIWGKESDYK